MSLWGTSVVPEPMGDEKRIERMNCCSFSKGNSGYGRGSEAWKSPPLSGACKSLYKVRNKVAVFVLSRSVQAAQHGIRDYNSLNLQYGWILVNILFLCFSNLLIIFCESFSCFSANPFIFPPPTPQEQRCITSHLWSYLPHLGFGWLRFFKSWSYLSQDMFLISLLPSRNLAA